jgi:WD40-like Beta Propeller Repeat
MHGVRRGGSARFAVVAGGLALMLAGCGTATAPPPEGSGGQPLSSGTVVYVVDPPQLVPVDLAHHRTGRPVIIPGSDTGLVAITPDHRRAYILRGASLIPVNLITGAPGRPLAVPLDSSQIDEMSTDGHTVYLEHGSTITPIDLRTGSAGRPFVLSAMPAAGLDTLLVAAAAPVACLAGITESGPEKDLIQCVDLATGTVGKPVTVPHPLFASTVALAPDGRSAYVTSDNLLVPVDLVTGSAGRPIQTPVLIGAIALSPDGRTAYAGNLKPKQPGDGVIIPIDLAKGSAQAAIPVASYPYSITDIVISPDGRTAYVAAHTSVIPVDLTTGKSAKPIPMPPGVIANSLILVP